MSSAHRRWSFWLADHGLAIGGLALLAVGGTTSWWAMSPGWAALVIAFFAWVAEAYLGCGQLCRGRKHEPISRGRGETGPVHVDLSRQRSAGS